MKNRCIPIACSILLATCGTISPAAATPSVWHEDDLAVLDRALRSAIDDALTAPDDTALSQARRSGDRDAIDVAAQALALALARSQLLGQASKAQRTGWHIEDMDRTIDLEGWLDRAHAAGALATFFNAVRPDHPDYAALRGAFVSERDPARKARLARNMERWRWMPHSLGKDYVLVNEASFTARLWRDGKLAGTWPVIVGKVSTPSPVFSTRIRGVILNPWWNIPASIVREKHGVFPASQGYVQSEGRWRQKPGPGNALGQMKLDMPNPYSVYMHDTPTKSLFTREVRAFSHGCIRTGDAIGFAATLLDGVKTRAQIDAILATRKETEVRLPRELPVYITYFTAGTDGNGVLVHYPDIYKRDTRLTWAARPGEACSA